MTLLHFHADGTKLCTVQRHSGNRRFGKRAAIGAADQRTDFGLAKELVYEQTGRNAFCPSTKKPERYDGAGKSCYIWEIDD